MHGRGKTKVFLVQSMKACRGSKSLDCSFLTSALDGYEARWAPELVWTFWRKEYSFAPVRIQTPEHATYRCTDCAIQALGRGKKTLQTFIIKMEEAKSC